MFVLDTTRTGAQLYLTAPPTEGVVLDSVPTELLVPVKLHYPSPHLQDVTGALSIEIDGSFHRFLQSIPPAFLHEAPRIELNGSVLVGEHEIIRNPSAPELVAVLLKLVTTEQHLDLDPDDRLARINSPQPLLDSRT